MKTQYVRCPKCGQLYNAEQGYCLTCYQPGDAQKALQREDTSLIRRLLWIFGVVTLLPLIVSLSIAYFSLGWQTMQENLSSMLLVLGVITPWLALSIFVYFLAQQKRKSALWGLLTLLIPFSPVFTIPYLLWQKPRQVDWGILLLYTLAIPLMLASFLSSVAVWVR